MRLPELGVVRAPLVAAEGQAAPVRGQAEARLALECEADRDLGRRDPEAGHELRRLVRPELVLVDVAVADELPSAARLTHDPAHDFTRVPGGDQRARAPPGIEHAQEALD